MLRFGFDSFVGKRAIGQFAKAWLRAEAVLETTFADGRSDVYNRGGITTTINRAMRKHRRLANLNKTKKVEYRHILQDWDVWLSKQDNKGNDVNLHLENIYLNELQDDGLLLYERIKEKFKNPLVEAEQFYLQYKLSSEQYPINIELSQKTQALAAFKKFAALKQEEYVQFGPVFVLYCRGPVWTTPSTTPGITITALKGRAAITRYLTNKYTGGKLSLGILDEMMTLATGALKRAVYGVMPNEERQHHGYLLEKALSKEPTPEELYLAGTITLKAYEETRFPEAKLAREKRDAHYPTPEEPKSCVVCRQVTATIACMECPNKICQACVTRECLEKEKSFLYFHHQHCLRFGRPHRQPLPEMENVRNKGMPGRVLPGVPRGGSGSGDGKVRRHKRFRPPSGYRRPTPKAV